MNKIKLKPCPFCGGKAKLIQIDKEPFAVVICKVCETKSNVFLKAEDAEVAWNRRNVDEQNKEVPLH